MISSNRIKFLYHVVIAGMFAVLSGYAMAAPPAPVEYLGNPGPISFAGTSFHFSWSSHPTPLFFKQEYIPHGQLPDTYTDMLMLDFQMDKQTTISNLVNQKIAFLDDWKTKTSDVVMHHDVIQDPSTGDVILDFVMSQNLGKSSAVIEWNAYRYTTVTLADGRTGVLLFGISRRGYGDNCMDFLKSLKTVRTTSRDALAAMPMPHITLKHP